MPELSLSLCGRVSVAGNVVQPAASALSAKSLALLAYLALEPGPHSRDELAALLWGGYPDAKAKASLRQALVHVREALPTAIRVTRASVELSSSAECDVTTFVRLSKESPRTAADFSATANSFAINTKMKRADGYIKAALVDSTPSLIVNGKYRLNGRSAGSWENVEAIVLHLVKLESPAK
jgi:DNA-binding SARP family transcriptional activator